jgi:XapX domain-containing protein
MKAMLISFVAGLFVGVLYGLIRVKSPAPPIIALLGLLGMVVGEQAGAWVIARRAATAHTASACFMGKRWDRTTSSESTSATRSVVDKDL